MSGASALSQRLLARLKEAREAAGMTPEDLAQDLILGPGWVQRFESGETVPDLDTLFVLIHRIGADPAFIFSDPEEDEDVPDMSRTIYAEEEGDDLNVHFRYADYDALYVLPNATVDEFEEVMLELRNGLAKLVAPDLDDEAEKQIKTNAVARAFLKAVALWNHTNPSDVWWFIIYRAYCDPYNHPARYARLAFEQSWRRTGGWALEEILVRHYRDELEKHGIAIEIARGDRRQALVSQFAVNSRIEEDKVDVYLLGPNDQCFCVVHVKASFAERRTDDVPMSEALIRAGYFSPLWTMDCKSTPSARPFNRGELGATVGRRSAKRKDIEDDGCFSACFSYNRNTAPTPAGGDPEARIITCDFSDPDDEFVSTVVAAWKAFSTHQ